MEIRVSDLNQNISAMLAKAQTEDVIIMKHGRAVAVLIEYSQYQKYLEQRQDRVLYETGHDFFKTLPKVDDFQLPERDPTNMRELDL